MRHRFPAWSTRYFASNVIDYGRVEWVRPPIIASIGSGGCRSKMLGFRPIGMFAIGGTAPGDSQVPSVVVTITGVDGDLVTIATSNAISSPLTRHHRRLRTHVFED
jgi:hypothetical protein